MLGSVRKNDRCGFRKKENKNPNLQSGAVRDKLHISAAKNAVPSTDHLVSRGVTAEVGYLADERLIATEMEHSRISCNPATSFSPRILRVKSCPLYSFLMRIHFRKVSSATYFRKRTISCILNATGHGDSWPPNLMKISKRNLTSSFTFSSLLLLC